ncbi:MAG: shikimate dehydrogenase [Clostridia bacterium]|nr:shikimate dehydrogenase [Clostridia bacterium]
MKYGCIGEKLGHSFSKEIHNRLADYPYELKELRPEEIDSFMRNHDFCAINVTIPYKQTVIPYLDSISPQAEAIGAVNTIVNRGGKLYGYNTDFFGMRALILRAGIEVASKKVLILGSGGTSKTARAVAADLKAREVLVVSRTGKDGITYEQAYADHTDAEIIINTTPCGMFPKIHAAPIDLDRFSNAEGVIDAVYNPLRTELILQAQERRIPAAGGLYMLVAQAAFAVEFFLDTKVSSEKIESVFREIDRSKKNIVLSGMPGCGKSTVGRILSSRLGMAFFDTDALITERAGKSPSELITERGEAAFRDLESQVIAEQVAPMNGSVIATGGGAILRDENVRNLKKNGYIVFLDRPLDELAMSDDRPLSSNRTLLEQRYRERYQRYCDTADQIISPASVLEENCKKIIEEMNHETACY